jgi:hypothetical protein
VVGFLNGGSPDGYAVYVTGFLHGLKVRAPGHGDRGFRLMATSISD